ncbi:MAG: AAA family ATPase, partial [Fusobacterium sp.]
LNFVGLYQKRNLRAGDLSFGQQKLLELAMALMNEPKMLLLDEPTAGLDIEGKKQLYEVIKGLRDKGKTILITSHDMVEVEKLCDRVAFIVDGTVNKIEEVKKLREINKQHTIVIETENNSLSNIKKLNNGYLKNNEDNHQEFICSDINLFINEVSTLLLFKKDSITNIYVKKQSIEEELMELIGGDKNESINS